MTATIVTIGDEILIGQITDTNSGTIARELEAIGIRVWEMASVSDEREHILWTLLRFQDKSDIVILTGGLGPTRDDISKNVYCEYFDDTLVEDASVLSHLTALYYRLFQKPLSDSNRLQAMVPSKAEILHNAYGSAPGLWMQKGKTVFVAMPGVPYEMKGILFDHLLPKIVAKYKRPHIIHKTILTHGQGESVIAERIAEWENDLPGYIRLAYLPAPGRVRLRLTARGNDKDAMEREIDDRVAKLKELIGELISGFDDGDTIEQITLKLLSETGQTLALAESCTGGKVAQMLTSVPGASRSFKGGIVCYSRESKERVLGVSREMIDMHSVVSAEVATAMAENAKHLFKTDYAIGITGNAGPTSDDTPHAVGVVFMAVATPGETYAERFDFGQPREKVIARAAAKSLEMLNKEILKKAQ